MTKTFRLRIEASSPHYDDAAAIAAHRNLNGHTFTAEDYDDATRKLRALGLDAGHGLGIRASDSAYPEAEDKGFRVWHLTGTSRRRLGNNCKIQQIRTPK